MAVVRCMLESDLAEVRLLLSKAFTAARRMDGVKEPRIHLCRMAFLRMYLAANPGGSFVLEQDGRLAAYCFSHMWGTTGWLGPLSVVPSLQGRGFGKEIVQVTKDHLLSQGAEVVGLELNAQSSKNLAFYSKLGFVAQKMTVDLIHEVPRAGSESKSFQPALLSKVTGEQQRQLLEYARILSTSLQPGLDYNSEVRLAREFGFGDGLLLLRDDQAVAFALIHAEPYSQEEERFFLKVNALQVAPGHGDEVLEGLLHALSKTAIEAGLRGLHIRACTRYPKAVNWLLSEGFKAVHNELRMTLDGYPQTDDPSVVNFSKWE